MASKKRRTAEVIETVTPPVNEFGEVILNEVDIQLSEVPTAEIPVEDFKPKEEVNPIVTEMTPDEESKLLDEINGVDDTTTGDVVEEPKQSSDELNDAPDTVDTPEAEKSPVVLVANTGVTVGLSAALLTLEVPGATKDPVLGVTKSVTVDDATAALRVTTEENNLINRLLPNTVAIADYDNIDPSDVAVIEVVKARITKHFDYIMGVSGFANERAKEAQLVSFADQLLRLTRLNQNTFFVIMDHIMTIMRTNGTKVSPTNMFRFNIATAKNHTTTMNRHNDFLNVCYKFAYNYAERNTLMNQIDFYKVCTGRTLKEADLFKSYFRKYANS